MSKFFLMPIFRVILFLCVSFFCRINMDNRVLLVSCIDLLKTKFTISLSDLQIDHRFLSFEMNIILFQLEFSSVEFTEAFTESTDRAYASLIGDLQHKDSFIQAAIKALLKLINILAFFIYFIAMGMTLLLLVLLLGRWFKVGFYVGYVGIKLVALVLCWLCWYYVSCVGISLVALVVIPSLNVDGK